MTSEEYFKGRRVAVFSLPGAFTPTCSSTHLPGYQQAYGEMKELGIDAVYCLSVNDAFVMRKWGLDQGLVEDKDKKFSPDYWKDVQLCVQHRPICTPTHPPRPPDLHMPCTLGDDILLPTVAASSRRSIPDGACQFTRGMGMSCTLEKERGFGERSWRSMARGAHHPLRAALERHSSLLRAPHGTTSDRHQMSKGRGGRCSSPPTGQIAWRTRRRRDARKFHREVSRAT